MKNKFEKYIVQLCQEIRRIMFLHEQTIFYSFNYSKHDKPTEGNVAAEININTTYLRYTITIFDVVFQIYKDKDTYQIIETLVHEHCHHFIDPIYFFGVRGVNNQTREFLEETRERQVQRITNVIMGLLGKKFINEFQIK